MSDLKSPDYNSSNKALVNNMALRHKPIIVGVTIASLILYILNIIMNAGANLLVGTLFNSSPGNQSDKYDLQITPMGWTFSIWGLIFFWNFLWLIYGLAAIFRKGIDNYLYLSPGPISVWTYLSSGLAFVLTFTWLFVFDAEEITGAFVVLLLTALSLYLTILFSALRLANVTPALRKYGLSRDVAMVWILHINALGVYATWCTVATNLNLAMMLHYVHEVSMQTSCFASLGVLTAIIVTWVLVDLIFLDRWTRHLLAPHLTLIWALTGSLARNYDIEDPLKQHTLALLVVAVVASVVKIVVMTWRSLRKTTPISDEMR